MNMPLAIIQFIKKPPALIITKTQLDLIRFYVTHATCILSFYYLTAIKTYFFTTPTNLFIFSPNYSMLASFFKSIFLYLLNYS